MKKMLSKFLMLMVHMSLFDQQTNVTSDAGMSVEMKTFYCDTLIDNAEPELVHDRWAQKRDIPKGKGKDIEFRKYDPLPKALVPLTEGVTPKGKKLNVTAFKATVEQYGDFIEYSDILELTTIDNKIIYVPNGEISGEKIVNYNGQTQRRVDLKFDISYDSDPEKAKQVIQEVVGAHPKALFTPVPFARVSAYNESSVSVTVRVWCATEDYWDLYFDLLEQIRVSFDRNGIELTYNHLNVHIVDTGR